MAGMASPRGSRRAGGSARRLAGLAAGLALAAGAAHASLEEHPDPRVRALWAEGLALERGEALLESSGRYQEIAAVLPGSAFVRWRLARNHWRYAERLPVTDKSGRTHFFGEADRWADAAIAADPECGECVFWKAAALGRLATTRGLVGAARSAPTIAALLERGIALRPTHRDGPRNAELANLYYASAAFYRIVPDWRWLSLAIGVRGDDERALAYIRQAIELCDGRVDYQVELGAVLLCLGNASGDAARLAEGRAALERALELESFQTTDALDREHARALMAEPARACGYSRDGWHDLSEVARR
jgi:hypothetical protein